MNAIELISQDLFDKVRSRYSNLEMGDEDGNVTSDPREARFFDFDFTMEGNTLGRVSISLNERGSLKIFYGQGILEDSDPYTQEIWFDFLKEMRNFAKRRLLRFDTRDITKSNLNKTDFQYLAQTGSKEDNMSESRMFGSSKSSYLPLEKTRLIIRHNKAVDETQRGARSRNINSLYVENAEGERFKYPFIHLAGAKAMQRHVANGGRPYDDCGNAIIKMSEQIAQLNAFKRHVGHHDSMHSGVNEIMERACMKLENLRNQIHHLSKQKHYEDWKLTVSPSDDQMVIDQATMEDYKSKFTVSTFAEDLSQYFPLIHSIMRETGEVDLESYVGETSNDEEYCDSCDRPADDCVCDDEDEAVKEHSSFARFTNWADSLVEGTLSDDEIANLQDLLSTELTLGVDGVNAIESLQGVGIEDEDLFSALEQLAKVNPEADPGPTIGAWLSKIDPDAAHALGMEHEEPAPANPQGEADQYADADAAAYGTMEDSEMNELSKSTLGSYAKKASSSGDERSASNLSSRAAHKLATAEPGDDGERDDRKSFNRSKGIGRAIDRLSKEDQVDELSKSTLGSYVKKAAKDAEDAGRDQEYYGSQQDYDRGEKRQKGIGRAVDRLSKEETNPKAIPKNTDYVDRKEKLAKASAHGTKRGPFHNIGKGLKAFVQGKEEPIDEFSKEPTVTSRDIAEMVKSFYDRETKKFPLGKTGVVTKVRKELGDKAAALAERLVNHLEVDEGELTGAGSDMAVEPNDSISPVHGNDVEAFEDIMRLAGLKK